jgi:hypothetical protein
VAKPARGRRTAKQGRRIPAAPSVAEALTPFRARADASSCQRLGGGLRSAMARRVADGRRDADRGGRVRMSLPVTLEPERGALRVDDCYTGYWAGLRRIRAVDGSLPGYGSPKNSLLLVGEGLRCGGDGHQVEPHKQGNSEEGAERESKSRPDQPPARQTLHAWPPWVLGNEWSVRPGITTWCLACYRRRGRRVVWVSTITFDSLGRRTDQHRISEPAAGGDRRPPGPPPAGAQAQVD